VLARLQREGLFVLGKRHGERRVFLTAAHCEEAGYYVIAPPAPGTAAAGPVLHCTSAMITGLAGAQGAARYAPRQAPGGSVRTDEHGRRVTVLPSASCDARYQVEQPTQFVGEFTRAHRERMAGLGG
jgi:hypothetical protein